MLPHLLPVGNIPARGWPRPTSPLLIHGLDFFICGRKVPVWDSPPHLGSAISKGWVRRRVGRLKQGPQRPSARVRSFITRDGWHGLTASTHSHVSFLSCLVQGKVCPFAPRLGSTQDKRLQLGVFGAGPTQQAHDDPPQCGSTQPASSSPKKPTAGSRGRTFPGKSGRALVYVVLVGRRGAARRRAAPSRVIKY